MEEEIEKMLNQQSRSLRKSSRPSRRGRAYGQGSYLLSIWYTIPRSLVAEGLSSTWTAIDSIIKNADLTICLTSKYLYIRECKKWFEKQTKDT